MKTIYLAFRFLRRNGFPFAVICLVMTVAIALLISAAASYQYSAVTRDALNENFLQDAIFFGTNMSEELMSASLPEEVRSNPAFGGVLALRSGGIIELTNEVYFNLRLCNRATVQAFTLPMQSGRYLHPDAETPEAVVSAMYQDMLSLGDSLSLKDGRTATLVGFVQEGVPFPSLSHWGSEADASSLFSESEDAALIYIPDDPESEEELRLVSAVLIRQDAPAEEQQALRSLLLSYNNAIPYDTLAERTEQAIQTALREMLPLPMFLLIVSTVSMMSVAALSIDRSMSEQSKYFLLGCSKRRSAGLIAIALSVVFSLPVAINLLLIAIAPGFLRFDPKAYLLGSYAILPVSLYWLVCLLLTVSMPVMMFWRYSPLTFYKRNL